MTSQYWLWDSQKSSDEVRSILMDDQNPLFDYYLFLLLSRNTNPKEVFTWIDKKLLVRHWLKMRRRLSQDATRSTQKLFWQTIYERLAKRFKEAGISIRREKEESQSSPVQRKLAKELRELRKASGLTQAALAKKLGLIQQQVAHLESGSANPTLLTLEKVAKALHKKLIISCLDP